MSTVSAPASLGRETGNRELHLLDAVGREDRDAHALEDAGDDDRRRSPLGEEPHHRELRSAGEHQQAHRGDLNRLESRLPSDDAESRPDDEYRPHDGPASPNARRAASRSVSAIPLEEALPRAHHTKVFKAEILSEGSSQLATHRLDPPACCRRIALRVALEDQRCALGELRLEPAPVDGVARDRALDLAWLVTRLQPAVMSCSSNMSWNFHAARSAPAAAPMAMADHQTGSVPSSRNTKIATTAPPASAPRPPAMIVPATGTAGTWMRTRLPGDHSSIGWMSFRRTK